MSLSIDITALLDNAYLIVNSLFPVLIIPIGFILGVGILMFLVGLFTGIFKKIGKG